MTPVTKVAAQILLGRRILMSAMQKRAVRERNQVMVLIRALMSVWPGLQYLKRVSIQAKRQLCVIWEMLNVALFIVVPLMATILTSVLLKNQKTNSKNAHWIHAWIGKQNNAI